MDTVTGHFILDIPEEFFREFRRTIQASLWEKAAQHHGGAGMEGGVHNYSYRQLLDQLAQAPGGHRLANLLLAAAVGADWPRTRRQTRCRQSMSVVCARCQIDPETSFHRVWACSAQSQHPVYKLSEDLISKAYAQAEAEECFWTRGLVPSSWMEVPPPPDSE
eukprot:9487979-Pyramimonas_sp.AAC.1